MTAAVAVGEDTRRRREDSRLFLRGRGDWGRPAGGRAQPLRAEAVAASLRPPPVAPESSSASAAASGASSESDDEEDPLREMGGANQHDVADPRAATAYA